jgi:hypothetical protein
MVRTPVQTNHMCDCPNHLHIDVVGTAGAYPQDYISSYKEEYWGEIGAISLI